MLCAHYLCQSSEASFLLGPLTVLINQTRQQYPPFSSLYYLDVYGAVQPELVDVLEFKKVSNSDSDFHLYSLSFFYCLLRGNELQSVNKKTSILDAKMKRRTNWEKENNIKSRRFWTSNEKSFFVNISRQSSHGENNRISSATTFSITTLTIMTLTPTTLYIVCHYAECHSSWVSQISPLCWVSLCWMLSYWMSWCHSML